jgi:hypothetical protein
MFKSSGAGRGSSSGGGGGGGAKGSLFGRVVDVILDPFHPEYGNLGESQSLNGVFYRELNKSVDESGDSPLPFAYCGISEFKKIPLKNEIIRIEQLPSEERSSDPAAKKNYWTATVGVWNSPHHNAYPDTLQFSEGSEVDLGDHFVESDKIPPIQTFPGDVIMESRHGSTIRLGGSKFDSNEITDGSNDGLPYMIISNGWKEPSNGVDPVIEDINEDANSIYLGQDHKFALKQANDKRDAFDSEPDKADSYKGNQIILNAGRIFFNAKEEGAYLSAVTNIGINGKAVGIDGEDYVGLDAKKVYLGTDAFKEKEPVLLGQTSTDWLDDFISQFETLVKGIATAPPAPPAFVAKCIATAASIQPLIPTLKNLLKQLHSKKVFTE